MQTKLYTWFCIHLFMKGKLIMWMQFMIEIAIVVNGKTHGLNHFLPHKHIPKFLPAGIEVPFIR